MKSCAAVEGNQEILPEGLSTREISLPSPLCTPILLAAGGERERGWGVITAYTPLSGNEGELSERLNSRESSCLTLSAWF